MYITRTQIDKYRCVYIKRLLIRGPTQSHGSDPSPTACMQRSTKCSFSRYTRYLRTYNNLGFMVRVLKTHNEGLRGYA